MGINKFNFDWNAIKDAKEKSFLIKRRSKTTTIHDLAGRLLPSLCSWDDFQMGMRR